MLIGFFAFLTLVSATFLSDKMPATIPVNDSKSVDDEETINEGNHDDSTKV